MIQIDNENGQYSDEIVAEFQELGYRVTERVEELLREKSYTFAEELLCDIMEEFGAAEFGENAPCLCVKGFHVSADTKELHLLVDELRGQDDIKYKYTGYGMRISLDEVYGEEFYANFNGIILPFDFISTRAPKKFTEVDEDHRYVVDVASRCISIYQALLTTSKWILSDHLDSTKKLELLRRAYWANVNDDDFGKIVALVIDYHSRYHINVIAMDGGVEFVGSKMPIATNNQYTSSSHDMEPWTQFNDPDYHLSIIDIGGVDLTFCDPFMSTGSSWELDLDMLKLLNDPERVVELWPEKRSGEPMTVVDAVEMANQTRELIGKCPTIAHIIDEIMRPLE